MADQKISELTAIVTPTNTNELAVNESGTSKKLTVKQIQGGEISGAIPFVDSTGVFVQDSSNLFWDNTNDQLGIGTNLPEGPVHIQTGAASVVNPTSQADDLIIQNSDDVGMTLFSPDANVSSIVFGSPSGTGNEGARLRWSNTNDLLSIATTETNADIILASGFLNEVVRVKSSGKVGIGTNDPDGTLHVHNASAGSVVANTAADDLVVENSGSGGMSILVPNASQANIFFGSPNNHQGSIMRWQETLGALTIGTNEIIGHIAFRISNFIEEMRITESGQVGIGTATPDASAKLQVDSTTQGFLPPRLTTTQRDVISSPAAGLMIYNTTTNKLNVFTTVWEAITSS